MSKFTSEKEIFDLVRGFETAAIAREDWHHAEHLTVAMYYLMHHDIETATAKMRTGIFGLLRSFSVDLEKEMPYHETLTVFWIRTLEAHLHNTNGSSLISKANEVVETYDKDYPLKFYSREILFSDEARAGHVEGDL
ncbi:MAG TPA: hypothetical protein VK468_11750 [Pyrinomonadaceae bacterium]|nr:hypothetical protein [Pyrinomonadaceae bacterium]